MHTLLLVTISLPEGSTSEDARHQVHEALLIDQSFCGEGGRFNCPLCDWFVIGGFWSGYLSEFHLGQPYQDALKAEFPQFTNRYFPENLAELHKSDLDQLWQRFGGTGPNPLTRRSCQELGHEDDAMLVDQAFYDQFLKPYEGTDIYLHDNKLCDFVDLDSYEVGESFIGNKWLVVVDYHN